MMISGVCGCETKARRLSLMPEGLQAAISVEQMADLLAFLLSP
jgi:hypothetical protein